MPRRVNIYSAERYVVAAKTNHGRRKLFQIVCSRKDGSFYVTFPYFREGGGVLGEVQVPATLTYPASLAVGRSFSASSHYVKYSHHPDGRAHFSLDGRVRTTVKRQSVPLWLASGHLFTFMVQGLGRFDPIESKDRGTGKRGVVEFDLSGQPADALKFVAHVYSQTELARRCVHEDDTPWTACITPDGRKLMGLPLATTYQHEGEPRYLMLTGERVPQISGDTEVFLTFLGGFDPPEVAFDHSRDMALLMFVYPAFKDLSELAHLCRVIDLKPSE